MDYIVIIGLIAAGLTTFAFLPQTIKTLRSRNTEGISTTMYIMFVTGVSMWIVYGLLRFDIPLIIANILTVLLSSPILILTIINHTKKKKQQYKNK